MLFYYILMSDVEFDFGSRVWDPCELGSGRIYDIRLNADAPKSYSFKITKTYAKTQGHYSIEIPTEDELKTLSKFNSVAGTLDLINNIGKPLFIDGPGLEVGEMMIKFERVDGNI